MSTRDCLRLALSNLRQNPVRTALCALSVAVGTGALLLIAALGLFGRAQVESSLQTIGVSGLTVSLEDRTGGNVLSAQTVEQLEQALPLVTRAMAIKAQSGSITAGRGQQSAVFLGVDEKLGEVMQLQLVAGSLLSARQADFGAPVAVVDDGLAQTLYGRENIVGRTVCVSINGRDRNFTVAGVVKAQTGALGGTLRAFAPHLVYIPYACLATPEQSADQVFVQCAAQADTAAVGETIAQYLTGRAQLGGTVRVQNMSSMVETVQQMATLCTALFVVVGGITLCVALIGVLCSMLAATHEKTGEIGIFLALGAQKSDILRLFLTQSVLLCALGGALGLGVAGGLLWFAAAVIPVNLPLAGVLLALSVLCGAVAGLAPALRAAGLHPVDAMNR